jgi:hypothetical protein
MKLRTDQEFNGRRVRLGDTAIVCTTARVLNEETVEFVDEPVARAAMCCGFNGDEPEWCIIGELVGAFPTPTPKVMTAPFVQTEAELVPGTWTW